MRVGGEWNLEWTLEGAERWNHFILCKVQISFQLYASFFLKKKKFQDWVLSTNEEMVSNSMIVFVLIFKPPRKPFWENKCWSWKVGNVNECSCLFGLFGIFYDVWLLFHVNHCSVYKKSVLKLVLLGSLRLKNS